MFVTYLFFRPFIKAVMKERKKIQREQRAAAVNAQIARRKARKITWTPEELEYLKQHAVHPG